MNFTNGAFNFARNSREVGIELAHVFVKRISGTIGTENQGAPSPLRTVRVKFLFAQMFIGGVACKARFLRAWVLDVFFGGDGRM